MYLSDIYYPRRVVFNRIRQGQQNDVSTSLNKVYRCKLAPKRTAIVARSFTSARWNCLRKTIYICRMSVRRENISNHLPQVSPSFRKKEKIFSHLILPEEIRRSMYRTNRTYFWYFCQANFRSYKKKLLFWIFWLVAKLMIYYWSILHAS